RPSCALVPCNTYPSPSSVPMRAAVSTTTSHGAPPTSFSRIAPTAPNAPSIAIPVSASKRDARVLTRPFAAPAQSRFTAIAREPRAARSLVGFRAGNPDDALPLDDVVGKEAAESVRRHLHRDRALLPPVGAHVGPHPAPGNLRVQPIDDRARRALRRDEPEPDHRFVAGHACLFDRCHRGQHRPPARAGFLRPLHLSG